MPLWQHRWKYWFVCQSTTFVMKPIMSRILWQQIEMKYKLAENRSTQVKYMKTVLKNSNF